MNMKKKKKKKVLTNDFKFFKWAKASSPSSMISLELARIFNSSSWVKLDKGPKRMFEELDKNVT